MDSWCPSCGYSVEPGTRFCGGCGQQLTAGDGAPAAQPPLVTMQSPLTSFPGQAASGAPLSAPVMPSAPPLPPPPAGSPAPWPPPPPGAGPATPPPAPPPAAPGQKTEPQAPLSDTMERMLRPQGLFQVRLPAPAEWQQPAPPLPPPPGAYPPPGGQHPQPAPYPQAVPWGPQPGAPAPYPPGYQYPPTGALQQAAPPPGWGPAPDGAMPAAPGQPGYPPGGQYPPGGAYQGPYGGGGQFPGGQYDQGQFPGGQFPGGQFPPPAQHGPDGMSPGGAEADGPGLLGKLALKRPRGRMVPVAAAVGVVVVVVVAVTLSSQGGSPNAAGGAAATAKPGAVSSGASALTQRQAATALSGLLAQSGGDRADVGAAVVNVEGCGKNIAKDVEVFDKAAANRHALLARLGQLPGRAALSPAMLTDLTGGWQASATVDTDLARWAQDQVGHCKKGNTKDPRYTASIPFDSKATNDKDAFVQLWNPLAKKEGLPARRASDL